MKTSPARIFAEQFGKSELRNIFDEFISDGAAVGRDGVTVGAFTNRINDELELICKKVKHGTYSFTSYREKLISKGAKKPPRQISIPTVRDKLVLKALAESLARIYPTHVSRLPHSTIKRVHEVSSLRPPTDLYLRLDIDSFFPSIDQQILLRILRRKIRKRELLHLIQDAITTPTGRKKTSENQNRRGCPRV